MGSPWVQRPVEYKNGRRSGHKPGFQDNHPIDWDNSANDDFNAIIQRAVDRINSLEKMVEELPQKNELDFSKLKLIHKRNADENVEDLDSPIMHIYNQRHEKPK